MEEANMPPTPTAPAAAPTPKKWEVVVRLLLFFVIPILIIATSVGIYLLNSQRPSEQKTSPVESEAVSKWDYSDNPNQNPASPALSELDNLYRQVQLSIQNRDYNAFKAIASSERIWHIENPKKIVGQEDGVFVFEKLPINAQDNFRLYSPYSILYNAPKYDELVAVEILQREPSTRDDIILRDPETGTKETIHLSLWSYTTDIVYRLKPEASDQAEGRVSFVWDKNAWKYNGEFWSVAPRESRLDLGDIKPPSASVRYDTTGVCIPQTTTISAGEAVKFTTINGRVYGISGPEYFDSGFLYNDNYEKTFSAPGVYEYFIQSPPLEPQNTKKCIINVR